MRKYYRTQLACVEILLDSVGFWVAGRLPDEIIRVSTEDIPESVRNVLEIGEILHAKMEAVPLDVQPTFKDWETC